VIFTETRLPGAFVIEIERREDERGYFARTFCAREFAAHGLETEFVNTNASYSAAKGTLRGMHFQHPPHAEVKLVRCTHGALYDVIIDLRPDSPTRGQWIGVELSQQNGRMLYVPEGFAHGFITLTDDVEASYQVSSFYTPGAEGGVRYDDPAFRIVWPVPVHVISEKDRSWPLVEPGAHSLPTQRGQ
jgi:dTDP-4-dehydrorhamnose 3,5-epimerase